MSKSNKFSYEMKLLNTKYDFVKRSKWYWLGSGIVILIGLIVMMIFGLNLAIDFTGGTAISVKRGTEISTDAQYKGDLSKITAVLENYGLSVATAQKQGSGADASILIKFQDIEGDMDQITKEVRVALNKEFGVANISTVSDLGNASDITGNSSRFSPTARGDIIFNAFVTIIFAISLMLLYIAIRFESMSGLATILGLLHDVVFAIAMIAIFRIQVNATVVAAIITIIGYSINNSIIVFDRIRENLKKPALSMSSNADIANLSIKQTLVRSVCTTLTTIVAVLLLAILGVPAVREFVLIIIFGMAAGVYSSLFLVPEFWAIVNHKRKLVKTKNEIEIEETNKGKDNSAEVIEVN